MKVWKSRAWIKLNSYLCARLLKWCLRFTNAVKGCDIYLCCVSSSRLMVFNACKKSTKFFEPKKSNRESLCLVYTVICIFSLKTVLYSIHKTQTFYLWLFAKLLTFFTQYQTFALFAQTLPINNFDSFYYSLHYIGLLQHFAVNCCTNFRWQLTLLKSNVNNWSLQSFADQ